MYAEWPSVKDEVLGKCRSVLHNYPPTVGKEVAKSVVTCLFNNTGSKDVVACTVPFKLYTGIKFGKNWKFWSKFSIFPQACQVE